MAKFLGIEKLPVDKDRITATVITEKELRQMGIVNRPKPRRYQVPSYGYRMIGGLR